LTDVNYEAVHRVSAHRRVGVGRSPVHLVDQTFGDERGRRPTIGGRVQVDPDYDRHFVLGVGAGEGIEARDFTGMPVQRTEFRDA
jgi:hypothetical protein